MSSIESYLETLTGDVKAAAAKAMLEYRANPGAISRLGVSELQYIQTRLIDDGLLSAVSAFDTAAADVKPASGNPNSSIEAYLNTLSGDAKTEGAKAALEYRKNRDVYQRIGLSEVEFVKSELATAGLINFSAFDPKTKADEPEWRRNPLLSQYPSGNEVGADSHV